MLTNNTLREILSNVISDFTYSTNERGGGDRERTVCKNSRCLWEENIRIRVLRLDIIYMVSLLLAIVQLHGRAGIKVIWLWKGLLMASRNELMCSIHKGGFLD
jgi:hypothetical protein